MRLDARSPIHVAGALPAKPAVTEFPSTGDDNDGDGRE